MQTGDYAAFFEENSEVLKSCQDPDKCTLALFNLSFLHCYSKSPYYDPRKGLKYIKDLIAAAPESPWAYQAKVWKDLIEKNMRQKSRKRLEDEIKSKEETIRELNRQIERSRQIDIEMGKKERRLLK